MLQETNKFREHQARLMFAKLLEEQIKEHNSQNLTTIQARYKALQQLIISEQREEQEKEQGKGQQQQQHPSVSSSVPGLHSLNPQELQVCDGVLKLNLIEIINYSNSHAGFFPN